MTRIYVVVLVTLLLSAAAHAEDAGTVSFAKGSVTAEREPPAALAKGDTVLSDDTVITGDASRAQLLMLDGAKIALRPNSELRIDAYSYTPPTTTEVSSSDDTSVMSLVKGGFRTITGAIGKEDRSDYEVRTAVGVLGIRGTDYTTLFCNSDCNWAPGVAAGAAIEDGLYLGVVAGAIIITNAEGSLVVSAGEYAFIPLRTRIPERLDVPPAVLIDDSELLFDADGNAATARPDDTGKTAGFDLKLGTRREPPSSAPDSSKPQGSDSSEAPAQPVIGIDADGTPVDITPGTAPDPQGSRTISFSTGPLNRTNQSWSATLQNDPGQYQLDAGNNLTGFQNVYPQSPGAATFDIGQSSNLDNGFDAVTVLRWGRWSGGVSGITLADGSDASIDLAAQSIHWITGPEGAPPTMPVTGTATYTLVGNTNPTDNLGNVGTLGSASFFADFTNFQVDSNLDITINGSNWIATGTGSIGSAAQLPAHLFSGNYSVVVDGVSGGAGLFTGFFSEPGTTSDPAIPGGVGLTYALQDEPGTTTVSGAAGFGNP